jgi:hypothetical protein
MSNFKSSLINDLAVARLGQPGGFALSATELQVRINP